MRRLILAILLALSLGFGASNASAQYTRDFPKGECTWFVYNIAKENGWTIYFSINSYRDAHKWWDIVTNASYRSRTKSVPNSIMVIGKSVYTPYGHVAWTMHSSSNQWYVYHSNFRSGTIICYVDGIPIYGTWLTRVPGTSYVVVGTNPYSSGKRYPLTGFLAR